MQEAAATDAYGPRLEDLYVARGCALFSAGHPLADRETVTLEELADEPLILFSRPDGRRSDRHPRPMEA